MSALATPTDVQRCLALAQRTSRSIRTVSALGDHSWAVRLVWGSTHVLDWIDHPPRLALTTGLGHPDAQHEREVLNAALTGNLPQAEHHTLRLARNGRDGELLLMAEWNEADIEPLGLGMSLLRFEAQRTWWALALHSTTPGPGTSTPQSSTVPGTFA